MAFRVQVSDLGFRVFEFHVSWFERDVSGRLVLGRPMWKLIALASLRAQCSGWTRSGNHALPLKFRTFMQSALARNYFFCIGKQCLEHGGNMLIAPILSRQSCHYSSSRAPLLAFSTQPQAGASKRIKGESARKMDDLDSHLRSIENGCFACGHRDVNVQKR
jgi:hypothetical protein